MIDWVDQLLKDWGRWSRCSGCRGYPRQTPLYQMMQYGERLGVVQYEDSRPPSEVSLTEWAVAQLPPEYRRLVVVQYVLELPPVERARRLGVSKSSYYSALHRAHRGVEVLLKDLD